MQIPTGSCAARPRGTNRPLVFGLARCARRGLLLIASVNKEAPKVPVLVVAGPGLAEMGEQVVRAGARRLLPKSDLAGLVAAVREEHARFVQAASLPGGSASGTPGVGGR
jgi:hypothetical protein